MQADGEHGDYSFERQAGLQRAGAGPQDLRGAGGILAEPVGQLGGHGHAIPKYVGSTRLSGELEWNATLLEGDLEDSIPKLKEEVDGDLFMHGSGEFAYALAEKGLIDVYEVYVNPIVWGQGTSTCSATGEPSG